MEEKRTTALKNGFNYGMITGAALIVFSLLLFLMDQHLNRSISWIAFLFLIGGMIYGTIQYRKAAGGYLSYGQAFAASFYTGLFATILASIYTYLFVAFIHPGYIQEMLDMTRVQMLESQPDLSEEQVEQAMDMTSKFMNGPMITLTGFVTNLITSAVIALLAAIFLKKEDPSLKTNM